jgi:hypothetical protein
LSDVAHGYSAIAFLFEKFGGDIYDFGFSIGNLHTISNIKNILVYVTFVTKL